MLADLIQSIEADYPNMVETRRYLHAHPELSFKEKNTAAFIEAFYKELGIPYRANVGGNGIVATIEGSKKGKTIALRADFDGLPIQDEKKVPYASKNPGVMHACGHDGHTATLLHVAKILHMHRNHLKGKIVCIHQHAEEFAPGGALSMIEDGALEGVDYVYGTHLWTSTPYGTIQTSPGNFMAAADKFIIEIIGHGGHGGMPHQTIDPIIIGSQFVLNVQQLLSRRMDPLHTAVISIGKFHAGDANNVIPERAVLEGTVRTFDAQLQEFIIDEMEKILHATCLSYDADYLFDYQKGYPPVVNHPNEAQFVLECAKEVPEVTRTEMVTPSMTGEDFSYYLQNKPGAFFFTGAQVLDKFVPHHHPLFDFDERAMLVAAKTFFHLIEKTNS